MDRRSKLSMKLKHFLSHGLVLLLCLLLLFILITNTANANTAAGGTEESVKMNHEPTDLQLDHSGDDHVIEAPNGMGVEEEHCSDGDHEECLQRRVMMMMIVSEAHLDYIYTQHHQKP